MFKTREVGLYSVNLTGKLIDLMTEEFETIVVVHNNLTVVADKIKFDKINILGYPSFHIFGGGSYIGIVTINPKVRIVIKNKIRGKTANIYLSL